MFRKYRTYLENIAVWYMTDVYLLSMVWLHIVTFYNGHLYLATTSSMRPVIDQHAFYKKKDTFIYLK